MSTYRRDLDEGQQGEARAWTAAEGVSVLHTHFYVNLMDADRKVISPMIFNISGVSHMCIDFHMSCQ